MKTKVRVKRSELLKVVDGRTRKAENEYKRAVGAYPGKVEKYQADVIVTLEKALARAKQGKCPVDRYGNPSVTFPPKPSKPSEGRTLCNLRRMRETLRMGADDSLLLSQDDADDYFGPCTL